MLHINYYLTTTDQSFKTIKSDYYKYLRSFRQRAVFQIFSSLIRLTTMILKHIYMYSNEICKIRTEFLGSW